MDQLCNDMFLYIKGSLYDYEDLMNLKVVSKDYNKLITSFDLGRLKLYGKFGNYKDTEMCINIDCYWDTWYIFENIYHHGNRRYIHSHQLALNTTQILVNSKKSAILSPYCCECFKKFVLIGDKLPVKDYLIEDEVAIDF